MAIDGVQLSAKLERGARGGPTWDTTIYSGSNNVEIRNGNWSRPVHKYTIGYGERLVGDAASSVIAFHTAARGTLHGFLFKDWTDYATTTQGYVNAGAGISVTALDQPMTMITPTTYQMYKQYSNGSRAFSRKITRPKSGTILTAGASGVVIDYATGIVTVSSVTTPTWGGEFYVPVRFDDDHLDRQVTMNGVVSIPSVNLIEILE